jgi:hypothetical protein
MNEHEYKHLLSSLNAAVDIISRHRTPDPALIAAYDTVKQARARVMKALEGQIRPASNLELAA